MGSDSGGEVGPACASGFRREQRRGGVGTESGGVCVGGGEGWEEGEGEGDSEGRGDSGELWERVLGVEVR